MASTTFMLPLLFFILSSPSSTSAPAAGISLSDKCNKYMAELSDCLTYSTGKVDKPPTSCCTSVSEIANKDFVCLCYIVQQAHNGTSQAVIDMGLQIGRLVDLPTVCKLHNADPKECPKLLGISANSPDYAIFNGTESGTEAKPATHTVTATSTAGTSMKVAAAAAAMGYAILKSLVDGI